MTDANSQFEAAVEAVVAGDAEQLNRLLRDTPSLVHERSSRSHRATLLHYVAANGVEDERQKTPSNVVEVAEILLNAGADIDAPADLYGGGATTLGLAATSGHPEKAGVQIALLETLLARGASFEPESNTLLIEACLANGRRQAAEFLASRGAPLTLAAAAGLGLLKPPRSYSEACEADPDQVQRGFFWACQYGKKEAAEILLQHGASLAASDRNGQTGLHHAVIGGSVEIVRWLLAQNPSLSALNNFGGTPLGQAHWCAQHGDDAEPYRKIVAMLEAAEADLK
jgi:ankyrin repeat protein